MAERSFYCPCDNFNMFDTANYDMDLNRQNYCKVSMSECIEQLNILRFLNIFYIA